MMEIRFPFGYAAVPNTTSAVPPRPATLEPSLPGETVDLADTGRLRATETPTAPVVDTTAGRSALAASNAHAVAGSMVPGGLAPSFPRSEKDDVVAILLAAGSTQPEADYRWMTQHLGNGQRPAELAEFYVMGNRQYEPDNLERDRLLELSLEGIHEFLQGKGCGCVIVDPDDRKEALRTLLPLLPPDRPQEYVTYSNALGAVEPIDKVIHDRLFVMDKPNVYHFGPFDSLPIDFSIPPQPQPTFTEGLAGFKEMLDLITHSTGRSHARPHLNDDKFAVDAMGIVRNNLAYDPERTAQFKEMLGRIGDPWAARGVMHCLDEVDPALRAQAAEKICAALQAFHQQNLDEEARNPQLARTNQAERDWKMGSAAFLPADLSAMTRRVTEIYALMQPGDEYNGVVEEIQDVVARLHPNPGLPLTPMQGLELKKRIKDIARLRDPGENLASALGRYNRFADRLADKQVPADVVDRLHHLAGERKDELAAGMPGRSTCSEILEEAGRLVAEKSPVPAMPAQQLPDWLEAAIKERKADETLEAACERVSSDWFVLREFSGKERLAERVRTELEAGTFGNATFDAVNDEIQMAVRMARVLGRTPEQAVDDAFRKVRLAHQESEEQAHEARITANAGFVTIGGVRVPVRPDQASGESR